jgi:hypothetical protein
MLNIKSALRNFCVVGKVKNFFSCIKKPAATLWRISSKGLLKNGVWAFNEAISLNTRKALQQKRGDQAIPDRHDSKSLPFSHL